MRAVRAAPEKATNLVMPMPASGAGRVSET
jgi:hypothetical protein